MFKSSQMTHLFLPITTPRAGCLGAEIARSQPRSFQNVLKAEWQPPASSGYHLAGGRTQPSTRKTAVPALALIKPCKIRAVGRRSRVPQHNPVKMLMRVDKRRSDVEVDRRRLLQHQSQRARGETDNVDYLWLRLLQSGKEKKNTTNSGTF